MNPDLLFSIFNNAALIPWLLMWVAPRWSVTQYLTRTQAVPLLFAVGYAVLLSILLIGNGGAGLDFMSLEGVWKMFQAREAVLIAWIHFLAFDLFVGQWMFQDAQKRQMPHWALVPCSVMTLMFGPFGWLLYMGQRWRWALPPTA